MAERPKVKTVKVNGTELHYIEQGEGVSVVFVHGGLGDFRSWSPQMGPFSECYHAISYSRRAHYPNAWPPDYADASMALHVEDLAAFIKTLGLGSAHLVANSYGGYISLLVAMRHPQLVRTLTLAEPPVYPLLSRLPGGKEMVEKFMTRAWGPAGEAFAHGDLEGGVRLFIEGAIGEGEYEKLTLRTRTELLKNAPEMQASSQTAFEAHMPDITCSDLSRIKAPTLLLRGGLSPRMYYVINDELALCLPDAEQALIPAAAHVLNSHNPEEHNRVVLAFLAER